MSDSAVYERIGQTLGKKFLVRRCLGTGGMGAVYEVEHLLTKRVGALKLLHPAISLNARLVERFVREASAAGRIESEHVVETFDAGELAGGQPYLFMELLEGMPVSELIERRGRLRTDEAREIVMQAAIGLEAAHAAGIVHRDVKPENLFLCAGEPARVKLLDFGISKFDDSTDRRLTAEGAPMGTPYYMSPEQVAGKSDAGPSTDIYSLGVVLYECVTGHVPFDAATLPALSLKIFEGSYAPPSSLSAGASVELDGVIARAMATAPTRRYATMSEFRHALLALRTSVPASLSRTLREAGALVPTPRADQLDTTADGAPSSEVDLVQALAGLSPPISATTASEAVTLPRRSGPAPGLRALWLTAALVAVGATPALVPDHQTSPPTAAAVRSLPTAPSVEFAPAVLPRVLPAASTPPSASASIVAAPPSSVRPARSTATAVRSHQPSSKAARDGLSEQNPFQ